MKKRIILVLSFVSLFLCSFQVKANSLIEGQKFNRVKSGVISASDITYGTDFLKMNRYDFGTPDFNGSILGYCLDPSLDGTSDLTVKRVLGDSSNDEFVAGYDFGLLEILKYGYSQYNTSHTFDDGGTPVTVSGDDLILATNIAVRTFTLGLFSFGIASASFSRNMSSAFINVGAHWSALLPKEASVATGACGIGNSEYDYATSLECFKGRANSLYDKWYKDNILFEFGSKGTRGYNIIYAAQSLFRKGLHGIDNYKEINSYNLDFKVKESSSEKAGNIENKIIEFNFKDIKKEVEVNNLTISCDNCEQNGIVLNPDFYILNGDAWILLKNNDINIASHADKDGKVKIKISFTKTLKDTCVSAKYKLRYLISTPESKQESSKPEFVGAILHDKFVNETQRYAVLVKTYETNNNDIYAREFEGTVSCLKKEGEDEKEEICATKITTPICSDESDGVATITAPDKITKCVLNKTDDVENSYQLTSNNGGTDNEYCQVFCKEDYASITLNKAIRNVNCGGYFKLKANIKGSKDCYTSSSKKDFSIDKEKYLRDIIDVQEKMISYYDDYLNYEKALSDVTSRTYTCGDCCFSLTEYFTEGTYTGFEIDLRRTNYKTGEIVGKPVQNKSHFSDSTGSGGCSLVCISRDKEGICTATKCSNDCDGGKLETIQNEIQGLIDEAKRNLENAQRNYERIMKNYNSCTTAWKNDFKFDQVIEYYYNENAEGEGRYSDSYYGLISNPKDKLLEEVKDSFKTDKLIQVCKNNEVGSDDVTIDEKYEKCSSNFVYIPVSDDEEYNKLTENNFALSYSSVFSDKEYTLCTTKGCKVLTNKISDAAYVKKSVSSTKDYITPTVFYQIYPTGKITVNDKYDGTELQLTPLENKLPVSTRDVGAGVFKLLISNLGEFYDTGALGRLINLNKEDEEKSIAYNQKQKDETKFNGEYVCYYYSSCVPDPEDPKDPEYPNGCPTCDFKCEDGFCEWVPECTENCVVACINCMFDLDELQLNFKTISTNNINSANREFGYNWNVNTDLDSLKLVANKAEVTIDEIKDKNDTIYDDNKGDDEDTSLAFSITMTPSVTKFIKDYNSDTNGKGGYGNDSLTCYDYTAEDGTVYENIFCYSELIDELNDENDFNKLIEIPRRNNNESTRETVPNEGKYWTPWNNYKYNESIIGGPAWK